MKMELLCDFGISFMFWNKHADIFSMIKVRNLNSKVHPNDSLFCLTFTAILMASLLAYNYFRNSGPSAVFINLRLEWSTYKGQSYLINKRHVLDVGISS